ncbi:MAG TPA: MFS transporter [Candidatus Methylomirabilis sp.]|nr:MFS transporter [Candidatus Methylomirabilis sp.]
MIAPDARQALRRDVRIIGLVSSAHFFSHFFQLALPPLFPIFRDAFGVPYLAFGLVMSAFFTASGIGQTIAGFLVDRLGARRVLLTGLSLLSAAIGLAGLSQSYWMLVPLAALGGLGNSVFHPADYSIFNGAVTPSRLGRAYSVHGVSGSLGWVASPIVVVGLSGIIGWRGALVSVGCLGLVAALFLASQGDALTGERPGRSAAPVRGAGLRGDARLLLVAPVLMAFAYFVLLATSLIGIQTFGVSAIVQIYEAPLAVATGAFTAFLLGSAAGTLAGGFLADRARRHDLVAATGMSVAAVFALVVASGAPALALVPVVMALTGLCLGLTSPSRDMLVRAATPPGASGKVYGFVYSGLDLGSSITPLLFGWLLDRSEPRAVFVLSAVFMVLTIGTVIQVRRHSAAPAAARI